MKQQVVKELHTPARRDYQRRKFTVRGLDETWQADLCGDAGLCSRKQWL